MHRSEDKLGRVRGSVRNTPRTIDIDMIDYNGMKSDDPELTLPHPRARGRDFVYRPWMELEKLLIRREMKRFVLLRNGRRIDVADRRDPHILVAGQLLYMLCGNSAETNDADSDILHDVLLAIFVSVVLRSL
jgi:hypothetical protein